MELSQMPMWRSHFTFKELRSYGVKPNALWLNSLLYFWGVEKKVVSRKEVSRKVVSRKEVSRKVVSRKVVSRKVVSRKVVFPFHFFD